ncbi:MAG: alanine--glyoxylate aminotransferase family protein [Acidobacteriota bacterium]
MIDETLTMIPGPSPVHPRILDALAKPTVSHLAPVFVAEFARALDDFRALCQSASGQPFLIGGGGTLAMEMALVNLVAPGEKVLVISQGYFGDRYADLAEAFGMSVDRLASPWGKVVAPEELEARLRDSCYRAVTMTHVDTSTGSSAPVAAYCELLRGRDELVILDGVCAIGGVDERFDEWGVDALIAAPQKAIGAPPGLAMCLFSSRGLARRRSLARVPAYYADILRWLPVMEDPHGYNSTPCVNEIRAVAEALAIIREEGLPARFARHRRNARALRAGLAVLGFAFFTSPECLADTLSVPLYPAGIEDAAFRRELAARGVVVAGCLGPIAGKAFRLGHMGNIGDGEVAKVLQAIEDTLAALGAKVAKGSAVVAGWAGASARARKGAR